jgi:hypothetical protein
MTVGSNHGVAAPEVGAKQLIGTIEEVETHDQDPTTEDGRDPWTTFHEEFGGLGDRLRDTYRKVANGDGPSEQEIKDAFGTLLGAWDQVAESVVSALEDAEVRQRLKTATASLAAAVGATISELGSELRDLDTSPEEEE